jgi:hypothetical protein
MYADTTDQHSGSDLEQVIGWARVPDTAGVAVTAVDEHSLPVAAREAVQSLRAQLPGRTVSVLAFRTLTDAAETARAGPYEPLPPDPELVALSVVTSTVSIERVTVVGHVVVAHVR